LPIQGSRKGELFVDTRAQPGRAERKQRTRATMEGSFSHTHAAVKAWLGEIGLNGLFLSPQYGPRVHLGSVITTALLTPDPELEVQLCDHCLKCVNECPAKAISEDGPVD